MATNRSRGCRLNGSQVASGSSYWLGALRLGFLDKARVCLGHYFWSKSEL